MPSLVGSEMCIRDRFWLYVGISSCPHSAGDHGPHGNHISTETPVRLLDDDPLTSSYADAFSGGHIPIADHHHVYNSENDPFGLVWNHNHGNDPAAWADLGYDLKEGSGGWPAGQAAPNQTYTHTHLISTFGSLPQRISTTHYASQYSAEEGAAGGLQQTGAKVQRIDPNLGYDHQHDGHGLHFHYHMYTHTHYADESPQPQPVELWRPWFNTRPAWWQDGMEQYFENQD